MRLEPDWGNNRRVRKMTVDAVKDVEQNCYTPDKDAKYALKYGVSPEHIRRIRLRKHARKSRKR